MKHYEIKDPTTPATKGQLWFLHCLTHEDTRGSKLTKGEAFKLIQSLKNGKKANTSAGVGAPARKQADKKTAKEKTVTPSARKPSKATEKAEKAPKTPAPSNDKGKGKKAQPSKPKANGKPEASHPLQEKLKGGTATAERLGAVII